MKYMPLVKSMDEIEAGAVGDAHFGILYGNVKSAGRMQYEYLFVVYGKDDGKPVLIVSSERNMMPFDGGSHVLGLFDGNGHANLGFSDDWSDLEKFFPKALEIVEKKLGPGTSEDDA